MVSLDDCYLLSEWCGVTSFYQSLQTMSPFIPRPFCATYLTLSELLLALIDKMLDTREKQEKK